MNIDIWCIGYLICKLDVLRVCLFQPHTPCATINYTGDQRSIPVFSHAGIVAGEGK